MINKGEIGSCIRGFISDSQRALLATPSFNTLTHQLGRIPEFQERTRQSVTAIRPESRHMHNLAMGTMGTVAIGLLVINDYIRAHGVPLPASLSFLDSRALSTINDLLLHVAPGMGMASLSSKPYIAPHEPGDYEETSNLPDVLGEVAPETGGFVTLHPELRSDNAPRSSTAQTPGDR